MVRSSIKDEIIREVDGLAPNLQRQVLGFARSLAANSTSGVPGSTLIRFSGAIPSEDLRQMSEAIEADCETVNSHDW